MLHSAQNLFFAGTLAFFTIFSIGCGAPENQVIEFTPESQAEFDAYNESMDQSTPKL